IHFLQLEPIRTNGVLEDRCIRNDEVKLFGGHLPSSLSRFLNPFVAQINISPSGKTILFVPRTLTVSQQHKLLHLELLIASVVTRRVPCGHGFFPESDAPARAWAECFHAG